MVIGIPDDTIWLTEPLVNLRVAGHPPRLSAEVQQWCDTCLTGEWRLYDEMCHVRVSDPDGTSPIMEVDTLLTFLTFDQAADEIAFRLRWLGS